MNEHYSDEKLSQLYNDYMKFTDVMASEHSAPALAGVMMAIAVQIYKSILPPEDFDDIMENIYESRNHVKAFKDISRTTLQ